LQAFFEVQTVNQLVIHLPALALKQDVEAAITVANPRRRQVAQSDPKFGPLVAAALIPMSPAGSADHLARPSFAHPVGGLQPLHDLPPTNGP
jgi:hypothetical protein